MPRNSFDLGLEYGNSDADVKHRFTTALSYELPVGRGAAHLNSGFLGRLLEGIQISGVEQAQTGLPFDIRGTRDNLHTGVTNRPQMIGAPYPSDRGKIVSTGKITGVSRAAFTNAPWGESVSIHRNAFHGPSYINTDASFQKTQSLAEGFKLQLRVESFNLLNHPNMKAPADTNTGSQSISSALFGISTAQLGQNDGTTGARQLQIALKLLF